MRIYWVLDIDKSFYDSTDIALLISLKGLNMVWLAVGLQVLCTGPGFNHGIALRSTTTLLVKCVVNASLLTLHTKIWNRKFSPWFKMPHFLTWVAEIMGLTSLRKVSSFSTVKAACTLTSDILFAIDCVLGYQSSTGLTGTASFQGLNVPNVAVWHNIITRTPLYSYTRDSPASHVAVVYINAADVHKCGLHKI